MAMRVLCLFTVRFVCVLHPRFGNPALETCRIVGIRAFLEHVSALWLTKILRWCCSHVDVLLHPMPSQQLTMVKPCGVQDVEGYVHNAHADMLAKKRIWCEITGDACEEMLVEEASSTEAGVRSQPEGIPDLNTLVTCFGIGSLVGSDRI